MQVSNWCLFLDDERQPPDDNNDWVIVRTVGEAMQAIISRNCLPNYISFDHDLGTMPLNGYDFAKIITELAYTGVYEWPVNFEFTVHSQNPVGRANIEKCILSYEECFT